MKPKTDEELYKMGWSKLDDYREVLITMMADLEPDKDNSHIEEELVRVEKMMERVG